MSVMHGDCLEALRGFEGGSFDSLVTDPPAGIGFMGRAWDSDRGGRLSWVAWLTEVMGEARRVLAPSAHGLVWAFPRTSHWTAMALEDAGFEIRDRITHHHSQGWPKGKNQLKPATEDWWLVRKPGAAGELNIDKCRVPVVGAVDPKRRRYNQPGNGLQNSNIYGGGYKGKYNGAKLPHPDSPRHDRRGRWPANAILSHSESCNGECAPDCAVAKMDRQSGFRPGGDASRFFYVAKASRRDRGEGNTHPTVKPVTLMRYLCRLITPPGGTILDPFCGSGTTGVAAALEGFRFAGIEREREYVEIARRRIAQAGKDALLTLEGMS